jgi:biotin carboxyl carrier protein
MADLAGEFLSNQRIQSFAEQQAMWQQLEHFIRSVHQGLDPKQTIYTIANEGRRLIDADRLSVATGAGRHCRVEAVSGLDSIERRAEQVKDLGRLAATVIRAGQPLWFDGDDTELPPQIEKRLHEYVDKSHCKMLAIIPLNESHVDPTQENSPPESAKPIGALIIEQLKDSRISTALQQRAELVATHSETALTNALDHHGIFLMPVWKMLGKITAAFRGGRLAKTTTILACLAGLFAFLVLFPCPFGLGAKGSLVPEVQHEVFAQVDGVLQEVFVSDAEETFVRQGQPLALMTNNDLMVEIENLKGRIQEAREKLNTNQIIQSQKRLEQVDRQMIAGEINSALQTIKSLTNELGLKEEEAKLLQVVSPADGRVVNWQVRQNLLRRPVLRGQNLMTIIDPDTQWQVELELPERRLAHLMKAQAQNAEPLEVTFGLVSHPGVEYKGFVLHMDQKLDVHSDEGNTALLRIGFANNDVSPDLLRAGTRVTAKVHCGTRSIGYVMFHELIETVQSSVLFWL